MTPGMVPWYDLTMPWLKFEKVWLMLSCTPFINRTITEEVPCFQREILKIEGESKFSSFFALEFFSTTNIHPANHRVQIWHFSGLIYHI